MMRSNDRRLKDTVTYLESDCSIDPTPLAVAVEHPATVFRQVLLVQLEVSEKALVHMPESV